MSGRAESGNYGKVAALVGEETHRLLFAASCAFADENDFLVENQSTGTHDEGDRGSIAIAAGRVSIEPVRRYISAGYRRGPDEIRGPYQNCIDVGVKTVWRPADCAHMIRLSWLRVLRQSAARFPDAISNSSSQRELTRGRTTRCILTRPSRSADRPGENGQMRSKPTIA
jgi:hypothetical protein